MASAVKGRAPFLANKSKSKILIYKNNMDSVSMSGISGNKKLTANSIRRFAIEALSGFFARCFYIKTLCVCRCSYIPGTLHSCVQVTTDFIDTDNKNYLFRSLGNTGNTIGISCRCLPGYRRQ